MYDRYDRKIDYLRVSVIDRCNFCCVYCRPADGLDISRDPPILSLEEILEVVRTAVEMGISKVRLTGGEPLHRRGILQLVRWVAGIDGIRDFAMTTNGSLLAPVASKLKEAGLHRVNISLDTLDPIRHEQVTRVGRLADTLAGIKAAKAAGLDPVKLNCVVKESSAEPDARAVAEYGRQNGLEVRFIRQMDLEAGEFWGVEGGTGGLCNQCNRLRLNCQGIVLPCLFSDIGFDIRELGIRQALRQALVHKPESGKSSHRNTFCNTGG